MIFLKTEDEIELLRQSNLLVGKTLAEVAKLVKPGVTTRELDKVAEEFIRDHGATPTFKGFPNQYGEPFPASLCTSVNEQVVHGIPGGCSSSYGRGIIYGSSCKDAEYFTGLGGKSKYSAEQRKQKCRKHIKEKNNGNRLGYLFIVRMNDGSSGCNRRTAADGRTDSDQCGYISGDMQGMV